MWEFKKEFICPKDKKSLSRYPEYKKYYLVKYQIAKDLNPSKILEIGVRAGYSAISFLSACPDAEYVGLDAENGMHGGAGGPWMWWAEELLSPYKATFIQCDTQTMEEVDGTFDLVHIDGDHSVQGALHDMELCWPIVNPGGVMLVDDYDYIADVKKAIELYKQRHPEIRWEYKKSLRGEVLFSKEIT